MCSHEPLKVIEHVNLIQLGVYRVGQAVCKWTLVPCNSETEKDLTASFRGGMHLSLTYLAPELWSTNMPMCCKNLSICIADPASFGGTQTRHFQRHVATTPEMFLQYDFRGELFMCVPIPDYKRFGESCHTSELQSPKVHIFSPFLVPRDTKRHCFLARDTRHATRIFLVPCDTKQNRAFWLAPLLLRHLVVS